MLSIARPDPGGRSREGRKEEERRKRTEKRYERHEEGDKLEERKYSIQIHIFSRDEKKKHFGVHKYPVAHH